MKLIHTISFEVQGVPQAKTYGQTRTGIQYLKPKVKAWEKQVAQAALAERIEAGLKEPWNGPCFIHARFYLPIPKSRKDIIHGSPHLQKPDSTNLFKSLEDGIKRVIISDDCLVFHSSIWKFWESFGMASVTVELYES